MSKSDYLPYVKQGHALTEFKGVTLHRNAHRQPKFKARSSGYVAPAAPAPRRRKRKNAGRAEGSPQICDGKPISGQQNLNKLFKGQRQQRVKARAA
jgi:hypothetical protein